MKKILFCFCACILFCACKKEEQSFCVDATVRWGGDPAADGAGWYLIADSVRGISFTPENIPDTLKIDGLLVNACMYDTRNKMSCECAHPPHIYHITSIRKL
jgi:hypothetical protein